MPSPHGTPHRPTKRRTVAIAAIVTALAAITPAASAVATAAPATPGAVTSAAAQVANAPATATATRFAKRTVKSSFTSHTLWPKRLKVRGTLPVLKGSTAANRRIVAHWAKKVLKHEEATTRRYTVTRADVKKDKKLWGSSYRFSDVKVSHAYPLRLIAAGSVYEGRYLSMTVLAKEPLDVDLGVGDTLPTSVWSLTLDLTTGKRVPLSTFVNSASTLQSAFRSACSDKYPDGAAPCGTMTIPTNLAYPQCTDNASFFTRPGLKSTCIIKDSDGVADLNSPHGWRVSAAGVTLVGFAQQDTPPYYSATVPWSALS
ncbi:MAG: hypothetical protein LBM66_01670 [Bifidobacteriaceae bacterium]|jgi:hypothetical protein|nr:hypothetical protein [Bifidobacteriaceae bacterium]